MAIAKPTVAGRIDPNVLDQKITDYQTPKGQKSAFGQPSAPQPTAAPEQGPTGFWGRISLVGTGKVNLLNAYKTTVEHKPAINSNNSIIKNGAKKVVGAVNNASKETAQNIEQKGVLKGVNKSTQGIQNAVIQAPKDVVETANKNIVQPLFTNPTKGPGADVIMKTQAAAQAAVKSGRVNKDVIKAVGQIQAPADKLTAYRTIADSKLTPEQMKQKLIPIVQKQGDQVKKALGDALQITAMIAGGGSTKELLASKEALTTGLAVNTAAGTAGNVGSTLSSNPKASGKQLFKSGVGGGTFGAATALLGGIGGKVVQDTKAILGKDKTLVPTVTNAATGALLQKGAKANAAVDIGKASVKGVKQTEGSKVGKQVVSSATTSKMSDKEYASRLDKLGKSYDKETAALQKNTNGEAANVTKVRADALNTKYETALKQLNDDYKNGVVPEKSSAAKKLISTASKATSSTPKITEPVTEGASKVSGSALKSEQKAVEANLTDEFKGKAGYGQHGYAKNSEDAVNLVHDDPKKAMDIAMGRTPGNNTVHEVAVRQALENKAIKEGDVDTLRQLASSSQHTATSESAQRLGAEGYGAHDSPVKLMKEVADTKAAAVAQKIGKPVSQAIKEDVKTAQSHIKAPSKGEWKMFVESLKC